jgi:hypothetical protein
MSSSYIHVAANVRIPLFFTAESYTFIIYLLSLSSVDGHLGYVHILVTVDSAEMNKRVQIFLGTVMTFLLNGCPRVEFLDPIVFPFINFSRNYHAIFYDDVIIYIQTNSLQ